MPLFAQKLDCGKSTVRWRVHPETCWEGDAGLAAAAVAAAEPARGGQGAEVPLRAHREACLDCRQLLWCAGCACVCLDAVPTAPRGPPLRWEASSECLSLRVACHRRALLLQRPEHAGAGLEWHQAQDCPAARAAAAAACRHTIGLCSARAAHPRLPLRRARTTEIPTRTAPGPEPETPARRPPARTRVRTQTHRGAGREAEAAAMACLFCPDADGGRARNGAGGGARAPGGQRAQEQTGSD